jgi:hypothetical protein
MVQQQAQEQQSQQDYQAAENIDQQGPPQQMPEDPLMAEQAQERLQGGPSAEDIQRREFEENAPS